MRLSLACFVPVVCAVVACGSRTDTTSAPELPKADPAPEQRPPETLDDLVRTINDDPSPRHFSVTSSTYKLVEMGDAAIPRMLDLMLSDDEWTRIRAERVLWLIAMRQHGFVFGRGWRDLGCEERLREFWKSLGDLNADKPREDREKAVALWRKWLASRKA